MWCQQWCENGKWREWLVARKPLSHDCFYLSKLERKQHGDWGGIKRLKVIYWGTCELVRQVAAVTSSHLWMSQLISKCVMRRCGLLTLQFSWISWPIPAGPACLFRRSEIKWQTVSDDVQLGGVQSQMEIRKSAKKVMCPNQLFQGIKSTSCCRYLTSTDVSLYRWEKCIFLFFLFHNKSLCISQYCERWTLLCF